MSYEVIARKWRPKAFAELVGQTHISQTLLNALKNDRLPHALLFTGPRGTGKTSSARILAKAIRCQNAVDFTPCNKCSDCQDISAGSSVNVIEIDGASNNGVEAIRELRDSVGYMPSTGKYKVYIIDEVHMLSTNAFNALLKTLEEPPPHVIFIMATTEAQKIPNTILSRCQRFDFRRISLRLIAERLTTICQADGVEAEQDALWVIARQGDGSMRDAQSLLDQVITFCGQQITLQQVVDILGLTDRTLLVNTLTALATRDTDKIISVIDNIFRSGYDPKVFMQDLLEEIRHFLLVKLSPQSAMQMIDLPEAEIEHLTQLSSELSEEDIHLLFDMALNGSHDLPKSQDQRIVLEMLLLRMSQAPRVLDIIKIAQQEKKKPFTQKIAHPPSHKTTPAQKIMVNPTAVIPEGNNAAKWMSLVKNIKAENGLIGAQLENTFLAEFKADHLKIGVPEKVTFLTTKLKAPEFQEKLKSFLVKYWGKEFSIEIIMGDANLTPKALAAQKKRDQLDHVRRQVEQHPLMQETNKLFKTQIKSIKEMKE